MFARFALLPALALFACGGNTDSIAAKEADDVWKTVEHKTEKDDRRRRKTPRKKVVTPKHLCVAEADGPVAKKKKTAAAGKRKLAQVGDPQPGQKPPPKQKRRGMRGMGMAQGRFENKKRALPMYAVPYDKNTDGELSDSERRNMVRDRAGKLFLQLDRDHDNRVSVAEARAACGSGAARYVGRFSDRDVDHDGYLSRYELENSFSKTDKY